MTPDLQARQDRVAAAHNAGDPKQTMTLFTENIDYSDYAMGALHMDAPTLLAFFTENQKISGDMHVGTRTHQGTEDFTVWEWDLSFKYIQESPALPGVEAKGQPMKMVGCSLMWWTKEKGEWKIYKRNDYASFAKD